MTVRRDVCLGIACVILAAGCARIDEVPGVIREAMKSVPYAPDSVIMCLKQTVQKGYTVTFIGEQTSLEIPGEGYLVWIDENNGVRWPHRAKLVWVPKDANMVQRILRQGILPPSFSVVKPDETRINQMIWTQL